MSDKAMITIEKGHYISRVWTFYKKGALLDVLMVLHRQLPDGPWRLDYRFRYYNDDEAFDSTDRKSFWEATFPEGLTEAECLRKAAPVLAKLRAMLGNFEMAVASISSDEPALVHHELSKLPGMHMKVETVEKSS